MRTLKRIIQYILTTVLALVIFALVVIHIFSSTVLNKEYVLAKLNKHDFYNSIYENVISGFENYIYQSGLDEEVLNNIVTKEKVEKDTKTIINNIYNGTDEDISTEEIRNNLNQNIQNSLGSISLTQQKAIDVFVDKICEQYEETITHTKYESAINSGYDKVMDCISLVRKVALVALAICLILISILTIKRFYRIIARIGTALVIDGALLLVVERYINTKIKINTITIFNNSISNVLRDSLAEILNTFMKYGYTFLGIGLALIVIFAIIKAVRKSLRDKERYTPEN